MADLQGTYTASQATPKYNALSAALRFGKVRVLAEKYTGAITTSDTLSLGKVPAGCVPVMSIVRTNGNASGATINIGWAGSASACGSVTGPNNTTVIAFAGLPNAATAEEKEILLTVSANVASMSYEVRVLFAVE